MKPKSKFQPGDLVEIIGVGDGKLIHVVVDIEHMKFHSSAGDPLEEIMYQIHPQVLSYKQMPEGWLQRVT